MHGQAQSLQCTASHAAHVQVNIGLRVLTRPIPSRLPELYRTLGTNYDERVLPSIIQASLRLRCLAWQIQFTVPSLTSP